MSTKESVAAVVIGSGNATDWKLDPTAHAAHLPLEAGPLKRILEKPELIELVQAFKKADRTAVMAQARYHRWSRNIFVLQFLAIAVGTMGLFNLDRGNGDVWISYLISGTQFALLAIAIMFGLMQIVKRPFEAWMRQRSLAEITRAKLFDRIISANEVVQVGEFPLLPLQLEYFRRYQLSMQKFYYRTRYREHAHADGQSRIWRLIAAVGCLVMVAMSVLVSCVALMPERLLPPEIITAAGFISQNTVQMIITIFAAFSSLLAALSLTRLNHRNAARYATAAENLDFLERTYLEQVRIAASNGTQHEVLAFIKMVQDVISLEHREWILLREIVGDLSLKQCAVQEFAMNFDQIEKRL